MAHDPNEIESVTSEALRQLAAILGVYLFCVVVLVGALLWFGWRPGQPDVDPFAPALQIPTPTPSPEEYIRLPNAGRVIPKEGKFA